MTEAHAMLLDWAGTSRGMLVVLADGFSVADYRAAQAAEGRTWALGEVRAVTLDCMVALKRSSNADDFDIWKFSEEFMAKQ